MKSLGIVQDVTVFENLLSKIASIFPGSEINFLTSYFNPAKGLEKTILNAPLKWRILTSAPESNSFYSAKGMAKHIPSLYQHFLHDLVRKSKHGVNEFKAYEFLSRGKTFHAKGNHCNINAYW